MRVKIKVNDSDSQAPNDSSHDNITPMKLSPITKQETNPKNLDIIDFI